MQKPKNHPTVFISYSHDSDKHKDWVLRFAKKLIENGVATTLDQWDLGAGDDVTFFMEKGVRESDRVIVICTGEYVRKANAGEGGVGYEGRIVTGELVRNIGTNKFIPIVRNVAGEEKTPSSLSTRLYIDLSDNCDFDEGFMSLLRELHNAPATTKPEMGNSPFETDPPGKAGVSAPIISIDQDALDPASLYHRAQALIRDKDIITWRQTIKSVKPRMYEGLINWQNKYTDSARNASHDNAIIDEAINIVSPILVLALAGVESGIAEFKDQRSIIDLFLQIPGWNKNGSDQIVTLPNTLCYIFQALHGATCMHTGQLSHAIKLIEINVCRNYGSKHTPIWQIPEIIGWPESLGNNSSSAWDFIKLSSQRWPWLIEIFTSEIDYRVFLSSYYMLLNVYELASIISKTQDQQSITDELGILSVPLLFVEEDRNIMDRAFSVLSMYSEEFNQICRNLSVSPSAIKNNWGEWIRHCSTWVPREFRLSGRGLPHRHFIKP